MGIKEQVKAIIVRNPAIQLEEGELCVFQTKCQLGRQVEKITTTSKPGIGIGVGIPVTKHFGIGIGKAKVKTTTKRELVWEKINCTIVLSTIRFYVKCPNDTYRMELDTFQDIKLNKDAITIVSDGTPYYFFMKNSEVKRFLKVWGLMGEAARQGLSTEDFV